MLGFSKFQYIVVPKKKLGMRLGFNGIFLGPQFLAPNPLILAPNPLILAKCTPPLLPTPGPAPRVLHAPTGLQCAHGCVCAVEWR